MRRKGYWQKAAAAVLAAAMVWNVIPGTVLPPDRALAAEGEASEGTDKWFISGKLLKNVNNAQELKGKWVSRGKGKRAYRLKDGRYVKSSWLKYKDKLYYIGKDGYRKKGWLRYNGHRYYLNDRGVMATGWQKIGRRQHYFNKRGIMVTEKWVKRDGKYYYFGPKGCLKRGWLTLPNGKKYYLDRSGARVTGDYFIKDKGYCFNSRGVFLPGVTPRVNPSKPMIALTFDDGPGAYTDRLLECLEKNNAVATFFLVGYSVDRYADTVKRAYDMGCEIGNHSWNHPQLTAESPAGLASQISMTNQVVRKATGHAPTLLRPPYGAYNPTVAAAAGMPLILWDVDTLDWKTRNVQSTVNSVLTTATDGSIVLMHDIHLPSVQAAEILIPQLKKKGYQLVTVSELAKYKKKPLLNGAAYRFIR